MSVCRQLFLVHDRKVAAELVAISGVKLDE
jgi:hypothetical protein